MNARLIVVQPGSKLPSLEHVSGDFADWVCAGLGVAVARASLYRPQLGDHLPRVRASDAIVITGSSAMVTDDAPWMRGAADWLRGAVEAGASILGICFGHQLLAHACGGQVEDNPAGVEVGSVRVSLTPQATTDPLLAGLPGSSLLHASHRQSVRRLPDAATHLAFSAREPHHAFRLGERAWGLQFHPEFSAAILRGYVDYYRPLLARQGTDANRLSRGVCDSDLGRGVLQRFAQFAGLSP